MKHRYVRDGAEDITMAQMSISVARTLGEKI